MSISMQCKCEPSSVGLHIHNEKNNHHVNIYDDTTCIVPGIFPFCIMECKSVIRYIKTLGIKMTFFGP